MTILLGKAAWQVAQQIWSVGFQGIDFLQYQGTIGNNHVKQVVGKALLTCSEMVGQPYNYWYDKKVLPLLPLPPLEKSLNLLQEVAQRILSPDELPQFRKECQTFVKDSSFLQICLWFNQIYSDCWANRFWEIGAYNYNHSPLRESSHWLGFDRADVIKDYSAFEEPACLRASVLLLAMWDYKQRLEDGVSQEELTFHFKGIKIDASTCLNIFSTRLPGEKMDFYQKNLKSSHVIIQIKGNYYRLDLLDKGILKSINQLHQEIMFMKQNAQKNKTVESNLAVLTTSDRREWYKKRELLLTHEDNKNFIQTVESALLMIHIEDKKAWSSQTDAARFVYQQRSGPWDDLTLNVHFKEDDASLICVCGHGNVDATAASPALESFFKQESNLKASYKRGVTKNFYPTRPLNFVLSSSSFDMKEDIKALEEAPMNASLEVKELVYTCFTKELCKQVGLNPDSVVHQAFQLAWAKTFSSDNQKVLGTETYGAVSMRAYKGARTEQSHPYTELSQKFVESSLKKEVDVEEKIEALTQAVKDLSLQKKEIVLMRRGYDRHLFALYVLSKYFDKKIPLLERYIDQIFHYKLSTSQLPQEYGTGGGFLPTEKDGIGIFYLISKSHEMRFIMTTYMGQETADLFSENLKQALDEISVLLEHIRTAKDGSNQL